MLSAMNNTAAPWSSGGTAALTASQGAPSNAGSLTGSRSARKPSSFSRSASSHTICQASPLLKSARTRSEQFDRGNIGMNRFCQRPVPARSDA